MKNKIVKFGISLILLINLFSCDFRKKDTAENTQTPTQPAPVSTAPAFNPDSAYQYVAKQVSFGPRVPNSAEHRTGGDYLIQKLKSLGATVQVQEFESNTFDGKRLKLRNIIGSYNPAVTNRILLASHWDTRPFADKDETNPATPADGANDGASGVGILLEIGRTLQNAQQNPGVGIDIIFFDGEDWGNPNGDPEGQDSWCLGSQYWATHKHQTNYTARFGVLLDMVGAHGAKFAQEGFSQEYAPQVVTQVWKTAHQIGYSDYFIYTQNGGITDDHKYMTQAGVPSIDIIDYDPTSPDGTFGKYHHRHTDNMSIINKNTLKAVGQTVLQVIYNQEAV